MRPGRPAPRAPGQPGGRRPGDDGGGRWGRAPGVPTRRPYQRCGAALLANAEVVLGATFVAARGPLEGAERRLAPETAVVIRLESGEVEDVGHAVVGRAPRVPEHPTDAIAAQPAPGRKALED